MTSPATDAETRAFFKQKEYFGLQPSQIVFFTQVCACNCFPSRPRSG